MEEQATFTRMPLIGDPAPAFKAKTTQGEINFPDDYKGKWVILFSHPADFTPVCTTEFMTFASMDEDFKKMSIAARRMTTMKVMAPRVINLRCSVPLKKLPSFQA